MRLRFVGGSGALDAKLVVLGEAPGRQEEQEGMPFVGASGSFLFEALKLNRGDVRLLNVRTYRPAEEESEHERTEGIAACKAGLEEQLSRLSGATTLLCVGADALEAVMGLGGPTRAPGEKHRLFPGITEYHGSVWRRDEADSIRSVAVQLQVPTVQLLPAGVKTILATYHPAFAMRGQPQFKPWIRTVIARAAHWVQQGCGPSRPAERAFDLEASPEAFESAVIAADGNGSPVSFDIENTRDNVADITLVGVCTGRSVSVCRWSTELRMVLKRLFARKGVFVGHNLAHDYKGLAAWDIGPGSRDKGQRARLSVDTMIGASLLWPPFEGSKTRRWLSLASTCSRLLNGYAYHKQPDNPATRAWLRAAWPNVPDYLHPRLYNGLDVWYNGTQGIWGPMRQLLNQRGML